MNKWYCIYFTDPNRSFFRLAQDLGHDRLFCPQIMLHESKRTEKRKAEWLFPNYAFALLDDQEGNSFEIVKKAKGANLVKFGDTTSPVATAFIDLLKARQNEHGVYDPEDSDFSEGDRVLIKDETLKGYYAKIKKILRKKVILTIEDLNGEQLQEVTMDTRSLEVVE